MGGVRDAGFLSQADWRFLLPSRSQRRLDHLVLLGGSAELADLIVRHDVARRVSVRLSRTDPADAVIMLAQAQESLASATRCIAQEGVLYYEIDRRRLRRFGLTPRRIERYLRSRDIQPTGTYCVAPGFASPDTYLPADNAALEWYLDSLYRSRTPARRALKGALHACARCNVQLSTLAPWYAVTAARGTAPAPPAIVECARTALGWSDGHVRTVLLAHGESQSNRITVLLFEGHASRPAAVAKFPRHPAFNASTTSEHRSLTAIRATVDASLRDSVPASALTECDGLSVAVQTCVPGATLRSRIGSHRHEPMDDVALVGEWLARFHRSTTIATPPAREWLAQRLVYGLCADYEARFGLTDGERALFEAVAEQTDALDLIRLPIVWQHTDFGPWNIYRSGGRISVIDWEWARHGPALADLLFFVADWNTESALGATPPNGATHFERLFCSDAPAGPLAASIHAAIAKYMRHLDLPGALLPLLLVYTVLERALLHATRFPAADRTPTAAREGNRHVEHLAALARRMSGLIPMEPTCAA